MKILILSQFSHNFGDDSAGVALINRLLSSKHVEHIDILYRFADEGLLPICHEKVTHYNKIVPQYFYKNKLSGICDIYYYFKLFVLGVEHNQILFDLIQKCDVIYVSPSGAGIGSYRDRTTLYALLTCVKHGKKIVFHLNTFDQSGQRTFRWLSNIVLRNSRVYTRERRSVEYLKTQNISSTFGIDSAFMLEHLENTPFNSNYITLTISQVNKWHGKYLKYGWTDEDYITHIVKPVVEFAEKHGKKVWLLPHTVGESDFLLRMSHLISEKFPDCCIYRSDVDDMYKYGAVIANSYMVVSCRYHGAVLAAHHAVPFIGIAYDTKTNEVCEYTGNSHYCIEYTEVMNMDTILLERMESLFFEYENCRKKLLEFRKSDICQTVFRPTENVINDEK